MVWKHYFHCLPFDHFSFHKPCCGLGQVQHKINCVNFNSPLYKTEAHSGLEISCSKMLPQKGILCWCLAQSIIYSRGNKLFDTKIRGHIQTQKICVQASEVIRKQEKKC